MGQIQVDTISFIFGNDGKIDAHQPTKCLIPRHDIKIGLLNTGRLRQQTVQHTARAGADALALRNIGGLQRRQPRQHEQMARLKFAALERLGDRLHYRHRRINLAPLLKPGIPGHANVRQHRHLFATQARRAPSPAAR